MKSAITPENPLPVKFSENRRYGWKVKKGYGEVLYDFVEMDYVIKNAKSHDKPRYQMIAGNELYAKMHERKRIAVMEALHEHFEEHIRNQMEVRPLNFPVRITMELYRNFGQANWDTDNMWVYHKAFLDTMRDCGYLPEDSVIYVRESGGTKFIPIKDHETPTMIFVIEEIQDVDRSKTLFFFESSAGKPGDICVKDEQIIFYTGKKKLIYGAAKEAIDKGLFHCLNNFATPEFDTATLEKFEKFIVEFCMKYNLKFKRRSDELR